MTQYKPPLAVSFIWNPSDSDAVIPVIEAVRKAFSREKNRPFSRGLNIPLFFFSSLNSNDAPVDVPEQPAERNIVFAFTSVNTTGRPHWRTYIEQLPARRNTHIIPIAVDDNGLNHAGSLAKLHCLRMKDWSPDHLELYATIFLAHEVYRCASLSIPEKEKGVDASVTIFLSHAKSGDTGRLHSEQIKQFIDNTNMNRFFDANEISPGYAFDKEIESHIRDATLLAIESDAYSSRYWCQREILLAKQYDRPIVVVDCLDEYEDRIFPAASNVPCVHIPPKVPICEKDILRVLAATLIESLRFRYSFNSLKAYQAAGWIDSHSALSARPPEIRQVLGLKTQNQTKICYPEPPIYPAEGDWLQSMGVEAFTPLWNPKEQDALSGQLIGISISDAPSDGYSDTHIHVDHLVRLAQDLARHLLARSATLIYGGDLRPDGFTEFILEEASILRARLGQDTPPVKNHLAWPLYVSDPEITSWRSRFHQVMDTVEHPAPEDVSGDLDVTQFLPANSTENSYIWSRCLTEMRNASISASTARICAGGRQSGYKGKMPGILEEVILALDMKKPLFLLGAFGGVVGDVCSLMLSGKTPEALTEKWQITHNANYSDLQNLALSRGHHCDYDSIIHRVASISISELSSRCGLTENEYRRLMVSPFVDECTHLVLKGLRKSGSDTHPA